MEGTYAEGEPGGVIKLAWMRPVKVKVLTPSGEPPATRYWPATLK